MTILELAPDAVIPERPFTDLRHTVQDLQAIRFMASCAWLALDTHHTRIDTTEGLPEDVLMLHQPAPEHWVHRIVVTQPERLRTQMPLVIVGFFGLRNAGANLTLAQELDRQLIPELFRFEELLAYVSVCLPTGNFGNLVIFATEDGKEHWGRSEKHRTAVRLLTPEFYEAIRLYNGELPAGLSVSESLNLTLVKYYDYRSLPAWRAVRIFPKGVVV